MNNSTEYLTLPRKGINPLKHTSEIIYGMLGLVTEGSQPCQETLRIIIILLYIECLVWPHKGFSTIKHTKINSELHACCLSGFASSCTKQGYQKYKKPIKNNTELKAWSTQGYPP